MPEHDAEHAHALRELAAAYGVAIDYWDWQGRHVVVSIESLVAVLAALDVDASTADAARAALTARADETWRQMLPPVLVTRQGWRPTFEVHVPDGWPVDVWVERDRGTPRRRRPARQLEPAPGDRRRARRRGDVRGAR